MTVQDLKTRTNKQEEVTKKLTSKNKEFIKIKEAVKEEVSDLKRMHEEILNEIAVLEMHQRELILCFRGIPE